MIMANPTIQTQEKSSTRKLAAALAVVGAVAASGALCVNTSFSTKAPKNECRCKEPDTLVVETPKSAFIKNDGKCDWKNNETGDDCDSITIGDRVVTKGIEDMNDPHNDKYDKGEVDLTCEKMLKGEIKNLPFPRVEIVDVPALDGEGKAHPQHNIAEVQWRRILPGDPLRDEKDALGRKGVKILYNKDATNQGVGSMKYTILLDCGDQVPVYVKPEGPLHCDFSGAQANTASYEHIRGYMGFAAGVVKGNRSAIVAQTGEPESLDVRISGTVLANGTFSPSSVMATGSNASTGADKSVELISILRGTLTRFFEPPDKECIYTFPTIGIRDFTKPKPAETNATTPAEANSSK